MPTSARLALVLAAVTAVAFGRLAAAEPKVGDTLNSNTASSAENLLPPEILKHYQDDGYVNPIAEWPASKFNWPTDFHAATKANEGKFAVTPEGGIVEAGSQKQPAYILGFPFPTIEESDPQAGAKVLWNFFYRTWYFGNLDAESQVNWVSARASSGAATRTCASSTSTASRSASGRRTIRENFLSQQLVVDQAPADLNGTAALTWRYRDPDKRDSSWAYVPALRRVRAVSPANRSDGFLGSDMSQDDGPFFDGKPEDFTWKLVGEVDQLRLVDPMNLEGKAGTRLAAGRRLACRSGPTADSSATWTRSGRASPGRRAAAALAKRRFYVIEGVPKDKYYLYGKLQLFIDTVTFQGAWNRKFAWKGELLNTFQVMAWNPEGVHAAGRHRSTTIQGSQHGVPGAPRTSR